MRAGKGAREDNMQPYAPTPLIPDTLHDDLGLSEEIKLYEGGSRDRDLYETLSVVFSILVQLEFLEKAFVRDAVSVEQYRERCSRLIAQYISLSGTLDLTLTEFCSRYHLAYPLAVARLQNGQPAGEVVIPDKETPTTVPTQPIHSGLKVAETVQCFITLMDALKLSFRSKDQLHPLLSDLMSSIAEEEEVIALAGRPKLVKWLISVNGMDVNQELSDDEARDLFSDIEGLYNEYLALLQQDR
ncbi:Vacuolar protein-sorting-associated protein 28 [Savitreella phatthalungensis]